MVLKPCPECQRKVSTSATSCPQCGYAFASARVKTSEDGVFTRSRGLGDLVLFGALAIAVVPILIIGFCVLRAVLGGR
jgi:ribosomal protein L40E